MDTFLQKLACLDQMVSLMHLPRVLELKLVRLQVADIVKEVFQKEPSRGVNPDEVVALGAAIQVPLFASEDPLETPGLRPGALPTTPIMLIYAGAVTLGKGVSGCLKDFGAYPACRAGCCAGM